MDTLQSLTSTFAHPGSVEWIGVRPARMQPLRMLESVNAVESLGLEGDRYASPGGNRQVTLIQAEHLQTVADLLGLGEVDPGLTRRNIVVRGLNLVALKGKRFRIGEALLEYTGPCDPCSRMESNLGKGGYNAMRGHGGITARVLRGGKIKLGDAVEPEAG
ncbi:MOSC domain-containing protein [Methyloversatilis thermotolerans]|uniref:MOSC domain-containing protein n=1 Tax=Methyloversatilis thermotolerans TaxID=1346290 RepID=UPI000377C621|nr:MOSC domain-containing protein [Methyloversatilis thermotolerans]